MSFTNFCRKTPPAIVPASPGAPMFLMSATSLLMASAYSGHIGSSHTRSWVASPLVFRREARPSWLVMSPLAWEPSATTQAPVSVARSMIASGLKRVA
jgi:hypothetical protein